MNKKPLNSSTNIVWMDLEMSGLDPSNDTILEIAVVITDAHLNIIDQGIELVINHKQNILKAMDEWNTQHHIESGLWDRVLSSKITIKQAESSVLQHIIPYTKAKKNVLAGNSIWQDRRFIANYMPLIDQHLHYRMIDVSSIKELARRWYPDFELPKKNNAHRAMDDIIESINELVFFRKHLFKDIQLLSN